MTGYSPDLSQFYRKIYIESDSNPEEGELYENLMQLAHYFDPKISDFEYLISLIKVKYTENSKLLLDDQDFSIYQGLYVFPVSNPIISANSGINHKILDFKEGILKRKTRFYNRISGLCKFELSKSNNLWIVSSKNISLRAEIHKIVQIISSFSDLSILETKKIAKDDYNFCSLLKNLEKIKSNFKEHKEILPTSIYDIRVCLSNTKNQINTLLNELRKNLNKQTPTYLTQLFYNLCSLEEVIELSSFKLKSGFLVDDMILNLFDNIPTDQTELPFEELVKTALNYNTTKPKTQNALKNHS